MNNSIFKTMVFLMIMLLTSVSVAGYVNDPPFEPQRTILWDFASGLNWTTPYTIDGPKWDEGEWECDEVIFENIEWFNDLIVNEFHQGLVGIDNVNGQEDQRGTLTFHVNNFPEQNEYKNIWAEIVYYMDGENDSFFSMNFPGQGGWEIVNETILSTGAVRINIKGQIIPNPTWEEFIFTFNVPAGKIMLLDKFIVSTQCIPEPPTLLILGLTSLALIKKKRANLQ